MSDRLQFMVPGKPEYVGTVRLAVSHVANLAGFDIEAVEDIKVSVSEACTNIVSHGTADQNRLYRVTCLLSADRLEISVEDEAGGFDMKDYSEPNLEDIHAGGLGIFVIHALMDDVEIRSEVGEGTRIRMTKYRAAE